MSQLTVTASARAVFLARVFTSRAFVNGALSRPLSHLGVIGSRVHGGTTAASRPTVGGRLRLTTRGRAILLVMLASCALTLLVLADAPVLAASWPLDTAPLEQITVLPGQSLWSIADAHAESLGIRDLMVEIERLNELDGSTLQPGQRLLLPDRR